ncbi:MAG: ABC transporter ATP-binding protein [Bacteroidetes bacterium]|nr:ABC transporter ATP-binding protein [Bacteroidota bacterium]
MSIILNVDSLSIAFQQTEDLVRGISFHLDEGEILAIVGESGSGKSITVFSLVQLLEKAVTQGKALYTGKNGVVVDLLKAEAKQMQKIRGGEIGFVFQEPMTSLNPSMRCGLQVDEAILTHQHISPTAAKEKTIALLNEVKLPEVERIYQSYPHQLSGGQRQRVMIAMALAADPKILIADEPTTALDASVQRSVVDLIKQLANERNMSVLFISHDLGLVQHFSDRTIVMYKGQIVEEGNSQQLFNNPKEAYTQALINSKPSLNAHLSRLPEMNLNGVVESVPHKSEKVDSAETIIKAELLNKEFVLKKNFFGKVIKATQAVKDISFEIKKGKTLAIVGESGSGKSTIAKLLLNLESLNSGNIFYKENQISNLSESSFKTYRRHIQMVFQDPYSSLNPYHKIGNIIAEPLEIFNIGGKSEQKDRVEALLKKVKLPIDFMSRYPHQLSGGQRQRICIARALATSPAFIVCDESVAALDVSVQASVLNLLKDLQDESDLSYLFITHDLHVARFISHHALVMQKGQAVEAGITSELFENPQSTYLQNLLSNIF